MMNRMNSVVCSVVLNDLGLRLNVMASSIPQKGANIDIMIEDVLPDNLKIKVSLADQWFVESNLDYSRVL